MDKIIIENNSDDDLITVLDVIKKVLLYENICEKSVYYDNMNNLKINIIENKKSIRFIITENFNVYSAS